MKKVLVLGATGMLGSACFSVFRRLNDFETVGTGRSQSDEFISLDAEYLDMTEDVIASVKPDVIVNCIGIIKPYIKDDNQDQVSRAIKVNSQFPAFLNSLSDKLRYKVIQIATDCVYSGRQGNYSEIDLHDATDVYGKTKSLGEITSKNFLNLRVSIIGPEVGRTSSLLEWFRSQPYGAEVNGFDDHLWNGITTYQFAKIAAGIISLSDDYYGTQHIIPEDKVTKYQLLNIFADVYDRKDLIINKTISKNLVDRTLQTNNSKFNRSLWSLGGYSKTPTIREMVQEQYLS